MDLSCRGCAFEHKEPTVVCDMCEALDVLRTPGTDYEDANEAVQQIIQAIKDLTCDQSS